jgi:RNA polymerase sigma-70 factor, ECF subfamily
MGDSIRQQHQAEQFEQFRGLLFSIAYRMTGSASDAEDLVQETYLRYQASDTAQIISLKAYLTTIITRLALDYLKSARVTREEYTGTWLPEPILTSEDGGLPLARVEQLRCDSCAHVVAVWTAQPGAVRDDSSSFGAALSAWFS